MDEQMMPPPVDAPVADNAGGKNDEMSETSAKKWRSRIQEAERFTQKFLREWKENVDYRRGKMFETDSDQDRIAVNLDWPNTKAKHAQLHSQMTQVRLTTKLTPLQPAVSVFARELNETLEKSGLPEAMNEAMPDVINASGIAAIRIWYESKSEKVKMAKVTREMLPGISDEEYQFAFDNDFPELGVETLDRIRDARVRCERVSPADLIWSKGFKASDFERCPWVGRRGTMLWGEASSTLGLTEEDKEGCVGADDSRQLERTLSNEMERQEETRDEVVRFTEIFYRRYHYHPEEMSFCTIQHLVFVDGKDEPVINEPWKGQQPSSDGLYYVGSLLYPIQFVTLAYVSDEAVPPSDSAIGRPQVDELIEGRTQAMLQRRHSTPLRWVNTGLVPPAVVEAIQKGTYQGFVPLAGKGENALGEIARASYPTENDKFDRMAKDDLRNSWQIGENQVGAQSSGEQSATEADIVQSNFQTRIGQERALVAKFFVRIAQVAAGLLALYGKFELPEINPEDIEAMGAWDRKQISNDCAFTIRKDSTVLLDANQEFNKQLKFLNETGKSGFVEVEPILRNLAELAGLDPDKVIKKPAPKPPEAPRVSLALSGATDLVNPLALAMLIKTGQAPLPEEIEAAKMLILDAQGMMPGGTPGPGIPEPPQETGPDGKPVTDANGGAPVGEDHPEWETMPRVNTRRDSAQGAV